MEGRTKSNAFVWGFLFFCFFLCFVFLNSWAHSSSLGVRWKDPKNNGIGGQKSVNPGPEMINLNMIHRLLAVVLLKGNEFGNRVQIKAGEC